MRKSPTSRSATTQLALSGINVGDGRPSQDGSTASRQSHDTNRKTVSANISNRCEKQRGISVHYPLNHLTNFANMRVKTDINISDRHIRLSERIAKALHCQQGQVLITRQLNGELLLGTDDNDKGMLYGKLYRSHGGWRCSNATLAKTIMQGRKPPGAFRCGEILNVDNRMFATIITRKNYAICNLPISD